MPSYPQPRQGLGCGIITQKISKKMALRGAQRRNHQEAKGQEPFFFPTPRPSESAVSELFHNN